jgi:uncharacterized protein (TIGR03086 family)
MTETQDVADRYRRLADTFATTIVAVPPDRWDEPSPCPDWSARDVVGHVVDSQGVFLGFVGESVPGGPGVDADPAAAWRRASTAVLDALADPEVAARTYPGMFGEMTFAEGVDRFLAFDLVVHRWDLARATGGDERIGEADAQHVIDAVPWFGEAFRSPQACGPEVSVPADADLTTRLLGLVGRRA